MQYMEPVREGDEFIDRATGHVVTVLPFDSHPYTTVVVEASYGGQLVTPYTIETFEGSGRFVRRVPMGEDAAKP